MSAHIPYGYRISDGKAVVNEVQAKQIRALFSEYISGKTMKDAAKNAGLQVLHASVGKLLRNRHYLGDDYYPAIIDQGLFDKAEEVRQSRASQLGRIRELKPKEIPAVPLRFTIGRQAKVFYNPYEQAEYAYSLIESEMNTDENR